MTHGHGHIGHGGGGGGGGHHHSSHTSYGHHHHHRHRRGGGGSGGPCFLFVHPRRSLFFFLTIPLLIVPLVLVFSTYGKHSLALSPRDTRAVSINTFFNSAIRLQSTDSSGRQEDVETSLYIFKSTPPLQSEPDRISLNASADIRSDDYEFWGFQIIPPGRAFVQISTTDSFDFYLFKGYSNFKNWEKDDLTNKSMAGYSLRRKPSSRKTITLYDKDIRKRDDYYFVFANSHGPHYIQPTVTIDIERSVYNISGYKSVCVVNSLAGPTSCNGDLDEHSNDVGIIVADNSSNAEQNFHVEYEGIPRASSYLLITLAPFGGVLLICGLTSAFFFQKKRTATATSRATISVTRVGRQGDDQQKLLIPDSKKETSGVVPSAPATSYGSTQAMPSVGPPSYEDVVQ